MGRLVEIDARGRSVHEVVERLKRPYDIEEFIKRVEPVVKSIREEGYKAVKRLSERFDGKGFDDPRVPRGELEKALREVGDEAKWALETSAERIKRFHEAIMPSDTWVNGLGVVWRPVRRVGVYVPAGAKPYPSTLLMTAIPARVAGSELIVAASPPYRGEGFMAHPLVEAAAAIVGVDTLVAVGGAQAVAAMAYGATPVPRVDKIVGPGSPYVEAAKLLVARDTGIDMVAGPSEITVLADESADPRLVALDLLAQAEHGAFSTAVLVTVSTRLASQVKGLVSEPVRDEDMGVVAIVVAESMEQAIAIVNEYAPEHLEVVAEEPREILGKIVNAGAVSLGEPVAYMDYSAGPSHVLPTSGAAKWRGGLSVYDFLKPVPVVNDTDPEALEAAIVLARLEGFRYHAMSLEARKN